MIIIHLWSTYLTLFAQILWMDNLSETSKSWKHKLYYWQEKKENVHVVYQRD